MLMVICGILSFWRKVFYAFAIGPHCLQKNLSESIHSMEDHPIHRLAWISRNDKHMSSQDDACVFMCAFLLSVVQHTDTKQREKSVNGWATPKNRIINRNVNDVNSLSNCVLLFYSHLFSACLFFFLVFCILCGSEWSLPSTHRLTLTSFPFVSIVFFHTFFCSVFFPYS